MARPRQHDAHVRARRDLLRRVWARWSDWGLVALPRSPRHGHGEDWAAFARRREARALRAIALALSAHAWSFPRGRYQGAERYGELKPELKGVGSSTIHALMCEAMGRTEEARLQLRAERDAARAAEEVSDAGAR